jgi:hypothetical protein
VYSQLPCLSGGRLLHPNLKTHHAVVKSYPLDVECSLTKTAVSFRQALRSYDRVQVAAVRRLRVRQVPDSNIDLGLDILFKGFHISQSLPEKSRIVPQSLPEKSRIVPQNRLPF